MKYLSIGISILMIAFIGLLTFHIKRPDVVLPHTEKVLASDESTSDKPVPAFDHIVIISMENKSYESITRDDDATYIRSLMSTYTNASNYFAVTHPSLPNYIALIGGSTFGITSDCTDCFLNQPNLVDQLASAHKTWKAYMESMPSPCFIGSTYPYAQKHDPFMYFDDIRNNAARCNNIVPLTKLSIDLQTQQSTPDFIWISPNLCHDMHDCRVATGDQWLSQEVPIILNSPAFTKQKSLLVITWDEGEGFENNNQILTIFAGNTVKKGYVSQNEYTHYSLLHTIENAWQMPLITNEVKTSAPITDIWQ